MSKYWESLAAKTDGQNTAEDFESAAYRLISEQVLYYSDKQSRVAYHLIESYAKDFSQAIEPFGVELNINSLHRYVVAKPNHVKNGVASVAQTLMALVLRSVYDEAARIGQQNDNGEVVCDLDELADKYRLATNRDFPTKSEFEALVRQFKRWGIAKPADEQSIEDFDGAEVSDCIIIRPAIVDILGDSALQRLGRWSQNKTSVVAEINEPGVTE